MFYHLMLYLSFFCPSTALVKRLQAEERNRCEVGHVQLKKLANIQDDETIENAIETMMEETSVMKVYHHLGGWPFIVFSDDGELGKRMDGEGSNVHLLTMTKEEYLFYKTFGVVNSLCRNTYRKQLSNRWLRWFTPYREEEKEEYENGWTSLKECITEYQALTA